MVGAHRRGEAHLLRVLHGLQQLGGMDLLVRTVEPDDRHASCLPRSAAPGHLTRAERCPGTRLPAGDGRWGTTLRREPSMRPRASRHTRTMDDDLRALRDACGRALTGHGVQRADALLATIPPGTAVDRYGEGGVVAELEAEVAGVLGLPAAVYLPSGTMAQQAVLRVHAGRRARSTVVFHPESHLDRHEGRALERLHGLVGRPVGDREPPARAGRPHRGGRGAGRARARAAAAGSRRAAAGLGGPASPRPTGPASGARPCTSTAPGSGRRRPATGGRPPRSPPCSTPRT